MGTKNLALTGIRVCSEPLYLPGSPGKITTVVVNFGNIFRHFRRDLCDFIQKKMVAVLSLLIFSEKIA